MKIRKLNEDAKRFYVDEIVSAPGGKTETERHSFSTIEELKQYCKDAGLTKDDIANCGGCDVKDLCESYTDVKIPKAVKEFVDNLCKEINSDQNESDEGEDEDPWSTEYGYNENLWDRGTGGNYNMYGKPSSYYADEVMEAVIEEFGDVLKTDEQKLAVYCYVEFMDDPEWVDTLSEEIEKLHTKPNGEYLVKADSGKGYTAFSRDNVAIGGIDNEDADSDDKAIDKFKRNEYSECLNEAYFDTAEYRIQKYEDDIPELMAGMHDDYIEGKLDAARYAEVLKKVHDALAECDYKHTMSAPVVTNGSGKRVLDALAKLDKTNEALGIGAGLALGGAAIGAGMIGSSLLDSVEDKNKEEETELNELFDIEIDAKGFGGSGNNVHVGPGSMPLTASLEENKVISAEESVNNTKMPRFSKLKAEVEKLAEKTGLTVYVSEPEQDGDNVDLWCSEIFDIKGTGLVDVIELSEDESEYLFDSDSIEKHLVSICLTDANEDDYDDDYSDDYDDSLEECSGIKAHKVIIGEDIDDSIEFDDFDDVEEPEGDKTEDIEFVMDEYVSESLLIDFIEKVDPITYKVGVNDQVVTVVFDPKWSEYVYTIDGKGPYSHSSYEFISRDIYDFVMSQRSEEYQYDDLAD